MRRETKEWHPFRYRENADVMLNSVLVQELAVVKPFAELLLLQVEPVSPQRVEAKRPPTFLKWFELCNPDLVPDSPSLREFIGGSIPRNYRP
jgi:uridine kinase